MCEDEALAKRIKALPWAGLTEGQLAGFDVIISRTGYTGERIAFELFVHPDKAPEFWNAVVKAGEPFGLKPAVWPRATARAPKAVCRCTAMNWPERIT